MRCNIAFIDKVKSQCAVQNGGIYCIRQDCLLLQYITLSYVSANKQLGLNRFKAHLTLSVPCSLKHQLKHQIKYSPLLFFKVIQLPLQTGNLTRLNLKLNQTGKKITTYITLHYITYLPSCQNCPEITELRGSGLQDTKLICSVPRKTRHISFVFPLFTGYLRL